MHDVTVLACGTDNPQVNIEPGAGDNANEALLELVDFAHTNIGKEPEELRVIVEGIYRGERVQSEYRHTIYVTDFGAEQRRQGSGVIP